MLYGNPAVMLCGIYGNWRVMLHGIYGNPMVMLCGIYMAIQRLCYMWHIWQSEGHVIWHKGQSEGRLTYTAYVIDDEMITDYEIVFMSKGCTTFNTVMPGHTVFIGL